MAGPVKLLHDVSVVILCGGQGARMRSAGVHKVCFPIDGVPTINRTVKMFYALGARRIFVVVGALAQNVIETVGRDHPHAAFIYQHEQLGTGHAARVAVAALDRLDIGGPILITMGDKVIDGAVLCELVEAFARARADLAFVTSPKKLKNLVSSAGRIVQDRAGRILGNVELRDIQRARIVGELARLAAGRPKASVSLEKVLRIGLNHIPDPKKLESALWPLLAELRKKDAPLNGRELLERLGPDPGKILIAGTRLTPEQVERQAKTVNASVYLASREFWDAMLPRLTDNNAQREFYLTDAINLAVADGRRWRLTQHTISDPTSVMGYNSPDELLRIEDIYRRRALAPAAGAAAAPERINLPEASYRPAARWLEMFKSWPPALARRFAEIYGPDGVESRRELFTRALELFVERFGGQRRAIVVRAPGRINLLGRHIDHRGGSVNVMAIDRDVVFVAAPREDDAVHLVNADPRRFPEREFAVHELLGDMQWEDWLSYVNSDHVRNLLTSSRGDWSNYIKASLLRLQQSFRDVRVRGFDAAVAGDIPMAAGLSSSSALVVGSAEIAVAFNNLGVTPMELVDLCGEGEWFVGSRGGAADHSAIRMARRGQVSHVRFHPFRLVETREFPPDCKVIIAHSGFDARKSAGARDRFNQKVASYELGFMLLKDRQPGYEGLLEHLRDINPARLNCAVSEIYRLLASVPESMGLAELREALSERHRRRMEAVLASHSPPERYDLRGVLMFGVAECARALLAPGLLAGGQLDRFGRLMAISHDGDRVSRHRRLASGRWRTTRFTSPCDDEQLAARRADLASEDPERVLAAQLYMQPGAYACSIPQIDRMIDLISSVPGVYGAQLGGAGLGGCIMILARPEAVGQATGLLQREYYAPAGVDPLVHVCSPVAGAGLLAV